MELKKIYNQELMTHSANPMNKFELEDFTYEKQGINPTCGDDITLRVKMNQDIIEDAAFSGSGCAISQASADILIDLIIGRTKQEAIAYCENFLKMIKGEEVSDEDLQSLDEALALKDISHMPARVKCAVLAWHTLENVLKEEA